MTQRLLLTLSEGIARIGTRVASAANASGFVQVRKPTDDEESRKRLVLEVPRFLAKFIPSLRARFLASLGMTANESG